MGFTEGHENALRVGEGNGYPSFVSFFSLSENFSFSRVFFHPGISIFLYAFVFNAFVVVSLPPPPPTSRPHRPPKPSPPSNASAAVKVMVVRATAGPGLELRQDQRAFLRPACGLERLRRRWILPDCGSLCIRTRRRWAFKD